MSKSPTEIRTAPAMPVEFRAATDTDGKASIGTLRGYAAVYGKLSQDLGGFVEQVDPAAFRKSLADQVPVMARYNHETLLGTTEAGTLRLFSDETGLGYEIDLPNTTAGRDVATLAERGDLRRSSFAMRAVKDAWTITERGYPLRTILGVQLVDVAPVDDPAYLDTSAAMRSLAKCIGVEPDEAKTLTPDEVRERLDPDLSASDQQVAVEQDEQRETHSSIDVLRKRLALEA